MEPLDPAWPELVRGEVLQLQQDEWLSDDVTNGLYSRLRWGLERQLRWRSMDAVDRWLWWELGR